KDDHTDYRVLGALARLLPDWLPLEDVKASIRESTKDEARVASVQFGYGNVSTLEVKKGQGTDTHEKLQFEKPGWTKMREGIVVELKLTGNKDKFTLYEKEPDAYRHWFTDMTGLPMEPLPGKSATPTGGD